MGGRNSTPILKLDEVFREFKREEIVLSAREKNLVSIYNSAINHVLLNSLLPLPIFSMSVFLS